jgi:hypothetical protein
MGASLPFAPQRRACLFRNCFLNFGIYSVERSTTAPTDLPNHRRRQEDSRVFGTRMLSPRDFDAVLDHMRDGYF